MASLAEIRTQYPQYDDFGRQQLPDAPQAPLGAVLPPGFVLDAAPPATMLPPGFVLDAPPAAPSAPRVMQVRSADGVLHEFPDGTDMAVVDRVMKNYAVSKNQSSGLKPVAAQSPQPSRRLQAGVQGAGRSVADTVGLAPDLVNMGVNAALATADYASTKLGGPNIKFRFPLASDEFANAGSRLAESAGMPVLDPEEMDQKERLAYNVNRLGGQAVLTAGVLAPVAAARAAQGANRLPAVGDAFLRAYESAPVAAATGDALAGAGAGAGLTAAQAAPSELRHSLGGATGVALDLAGMAGGQIAGSTLSGLASRGPGYVVDRAVAGMPAREIPLDPETRLPVSNSSADDAARFVQSQAMEPTAAAAAIKQNANTYRDMGAPMPTSGAMSNDPKLAALERGQRRLVPAEFAPNDRALRDTAVETIEGIQPKDVEPRVATTFIANAAADRIKASESNLQTSKAELASAENGQRSVADAIRSFSGKGADASATLDRVITQGGLAPAQREKNARYESIDPNREVMRDVTPMVELARRIEQGVAEIPAALQREMVPQQLLNDIKGMAKTTEQRTITSPITDASGFPFVRTESVPTGGSGEISFGAMNDMRSGLASASAAARNAGQYRLAENLDGFRKLIGKEGDALASEGGPAGERARAANEYYRNEFAPVWNRGPGDEAARFRDDYNTDRINRTTTPPTATANRFLGTGPGAREKSESLSRVIGSLADPQDKEAATGAVRQYVLNEMTRTLGNDGKVDAQQLARWLNGPSGWREALAPFPSVLSEVEKTLADVVAGKARHNALANVVERNAAALKRTQDDVANSALSLVIGREPTKAARAVLESRDPKMAMREIRETIGGNKAVLPAWERAVTDHLVDRITNIDPSGVSAGERSINYGKLLKTFDRYEDALGELYAGQPEKMRALRQTQKLLEPLARQSGPATTATPTSGGAADLWKLLEVGLKAHYGILKGGGVLRTLKLASSYGANGTSDAQRLVTRMMFDPELAQHLLARQVRDAGSPAWNAKLGKLLRRTEAGRELFGEQDAQ